MGEPAEAVGRGQEIDPVREMLAELGESRRLYLLSDLPRDVVEELGCVPVETADEIALLAGPQLEGVALRTRWVTAEPGETFIREGDKVKKGSPLIRTSDGTVSSSRD